MMIGLVLPLYLQGQNCLFERGERLLSRYVDEFNATDAELYKQDIPNNEAFRFLKENIPLFECPDKSLEKTYYFRWWTYRKHIKKTVDGYVVTEFLPDVPWAGKYNTISCAASHHFNEGRWLKDRTLLAGYARFWFEGGGNPRLYSFGAAHATYTFYLVHGDKQLLIDLYPALKDNFRRWEEEKRDSTQLFWQTDDRDGMEMSVSGRLSEKGKGYRPTINSYMYGEVVALSKIARLAGSEEDSRLYEKKAGQLKRLINERLWDERADFYKVIPCNGAMLFSHAREILGYTPWLYNLPPETHSRAWNQLFDKQGFYAPYGPTTVEQRCPDFQLSYEGHECQWNGPSWPYSTAVTLTALANFLNNYSSRNVTKEDYFCLLSIYSNSHRRVNDQGDTICWIDENLNPYTGDWISRTRLKSWNNATWDTSKGGEERGKDYNHSSFCDLIISGLIGIRPQDDGSIRIHPLVPDGLWDYFRLEHVVCQGKTISVVYDKTGTVYGKGKGFRVYVGSRCVIHKAKVQPVLID